MDKKAIEKLIEEYQRYEKKRRIKIVIIFVIVIVALIVLFMPYDYTFAYDGKVPVCVVGGKVQSDHIKTRQKIKEIADVKTFDELLERCMLTDEEKYIMRQHYYKGRSFQSIAMEICISEDWLKHKHKKILRKIRQLL